MSGVISKNKILVLGGSGRLGTALKNSREFKNADFPIRSDLNLLKVKTIKKLQFISLLLEEILLQKAPLNT